MTRILTLVHEFAPAKVNLYLHVVGCRYDGYHLLDSLVTFANIGDTITLIQATELSLHISGPFSSSLDDVSNNIVLKAARLLAQEIGHTLSVGIILDKQLPVAAGLGGGSADAAATLRGLVRLWGINILDERLFAVALSVGADVPVCLHSVPAQVSGIGEIITPVHSLPSAWLVLVNPLRHVMTTSVFNTCTCYSTTMPIRETLDDVISLAQALKTRRNDLYDAALSLEPSIGIVLETLSLLPGCLMARMSGSGATCFGLFANSSAAYCAAHVLAADRPTWWSSAVPLYSSSKGSLVSFGGKDIHF